MLVGFVRQAVQRRGIAHIGGDRQNLGAGRRQLVGDLVKPVGRDVRQHQPHAEIGRHMGQAFADATRRSGDDRDASAEDFLRAHIVLPCQPLEHRTAARLLSYPEKPFKTNVFPCGFRLKGGQQKSGAPRDAAFL